MAGVKIGSGSLSDSRNPAGSLIPQTEPLFLYSFHPDPEIYPRTTHSMVTMSAQTTSIERPRNWSAYFCSSAGYCAMSAVARWLGDDVLEKLKPEQRQLRQYASLFRDAGGQHVIESRDAVGGHEQQVIGIDLVDVADFSAGVEFKFGDIGLEKNVVGFCRLYHCLALIGKLELAVIVFARRIFVNGLEKAPESFGRFSLKSS